MTPLIPTDDQLRSAGGWQAMQEARRLVQMGAVRSVDLSAAKDGVFTGTMIVGGAERRVILRWPSVRDVKVACSCPAARRGLVCAHGLAIAIAARNPPGPPDAATTASGPEPPKPAISVKSPPDDPERLPAGVKLSGKRVRVRLPSQLNKNWEKGALPVLFEEVFLATAQDSVVLENLQAWIGNMLGKTTSLPPALRLEGGLAGQFLTWLSTRQITLPAPEGNWQISPEPWRPTIRVEQIPQNTEKVRLVRMDTLSTRRVTGPGGWLADEDERTLFPVVLSTSLPRSVQALFDPARAVAMEIGTNEFLRLSSELSAAAELETDDLGLVVRPQSPSIRLLLDGAIGELLARIEADYQAGEPLALPPAPGVSDDFPRPHPTDAKVFLARVPEAEASALSLLQSWGFRPHAEVSQTFTITGETLVLTFFASMGRLVPADWELVSGDRWKHATKDIEAASFHFSGRPAGPGWLEGEVACTTGSGITIPRADLHRLLRGRRGDFHAKNGKRVVVDLGMAAEIEEVLRDMGADQSEPGRFRFRADQESYLRTMLGEKVSDAPASPALSTEEAGAAWELLRPYQRAGVAWLAGQAGHGLGALLADDMGLGKTLQSLVFLEWQRRQGIAGPALVICPTSLLGTWRDEGARFLPHWKVMVQHGLGRKDYWDVMDAADLVITTYALLASDLDRYRDHPFRAVVLDEASLIRNPDSQSAKAVHALSVATRVALTGTPIENSVRDLWSIMRFVQPGYLGRREDFKQRFEQSLASGDVSVASRLQKRLRPFLLRRLKTEVATDLPSRIEQTAWCEMEGPQAALYNAILRESREKLSDTIRKDGFGKARMGVLTALLRLRQICCDPGLVYDQDGTPGGGAKRELFRELLREAIDGGHRVLVFSQFVGMLERLREDVREIGHDCAWLTGSSTDRAEQVRAFQEGKHQVFLLSLKAGGYGLTLTAADTVFLYDPWWNPAVEAQAIDRAHRIGQAEVVTAYRFAARGTVEEKILRLQEKKRDIANRALTDAADFDGLGESDLRALLEV